MKDKIREVIEMHDSLVEYKHGKEHCILPEHYDELAAELVKLFTTPIIGSPLIKIEKRELLDNEFYCNKCDTIHTKTAYAIAQTAMNIELIFTCTCGNKIDL